MSRSGEASGALPRPRNAGAIRPVRAASWVEQARCSPAARQRWKLALGAEFS